MAKGSGTTKYAGSGSTSATRTAAEAPAKGGNAISNLTSFKDGEKVSIGGIQFSHYRVEGDDDNIYGNHSYFQGIDTVKTDSDTYRVFMNSISSQKAVINVNGSNGPIFSVMKEVVVPTSSMSNLKERVMKAIEEYEKNPKKRLENGQKYFGNASSGSSSSVSLKHITASSSPFFKKK